MKLQYYYTRNLSLSSLCDSDNMESLLFFFAIFFPLLLVILIRSTSTKNLPPGPWKLPIIGNIHQFVGYMPHQRLRDLASKYGPIMHLQLGQLPLLVISSPELAKEVMKTHDLVFASRPAILPARIIAYNARDVVFAPYGDYWRQMKKICTLEIFSAKRVQSFRSTREEEISYLIRSITSSAGAPVNISRMAIALLYSIISRSAFGKALNQKDAFTPLIQKAVSVFEGFTIPDLFPSIKILEVISGMRSKLEKLHEEVDAVIEDILTEHKERKKSENNETEDLVDVLLNLQDHGKLDSPLTTEDIKAIIMDMFLAGVDTTSTLTEWTMSEIVKNPKVMERAQEEVRRVFKGTEKVDETNLHNFTYLNSIIKETLRLHPPAALLAPRETREGVEVCGYKIPERTRVVVNAWAMGRDPRNWTDPERFSPERFLNSAVDYKGNHFEYTPFGAGRRMCPGILYGTTIVGLLLANLLYHFDWMVPNGVKPEDLDMTEAFGAVTRRRNELCLIPTPYVPQ